MKPLHILTFLLIPIFSLHSQTASDTLPEPMTLGETVISASRMPENRSAVAQQIKVIRKSQVERINTQTTADLLTASGAVFVQKSQQGGGSPVLRGFEASRVLLVVDGVRLNNAIYRSGHLQNVITVDQNLLERTEILFGPASTLYGSDALGGAVCFYSKNPEFASEGRGLKFTGQAFARYGSVNEEKTGHLDFSLGGRKLAALTSVTYSDFGDLRMGDNPQNRDRFGERPLYVSRIGGRDSLVRNSDNLVQVQSAFRQYDLLEKIVFKPSETQQHTLNIQYSTSTDIPRYDRLTDPGGAGLRFAEWYYGPQERLLGAYSFNLRSAGWFDNLSVTASWQNIEESRHQRRFGNNNLQHRIENVGVAGLNVDARHLWGSQMLQIGFDGQYNDVQSKANAENIVTGASSPLDTRYPNGGNNLATAALYAHHRWQPGPTDRFTISEGLRAGYARLQSKFSDKTFFPFPFDEIVQENPVVSGSLGALWRFTSNWRLALNASTGYRVPNVDDIAKVFESAPGQLVVPNPDLKPEKTVNLDLNLAYHLPGSLDWETVVWATDVYDALVTDYFQLNGQDSVLYNGQVSRVLATQNKRRARLYGFSTELEVDITPTLAAYGNVSYTYGRILSTDVEEEQPLDHIPPVFGRAGLRYNASRLGLEGFVLFNGKKDIKDYLLNGEDNEQYAPPGGMPAWWTLNLRAQYRLGFLTLQAGVDNLLDAQYRAFSSGINGPGRNVFVTLRVKW